ncbi:MerR family transcriptional regulator [Asaia bogorensis]|uniref:MerR family transcriptional regulator n=1 Tax=Asaia bogorensis NBRC 16594 TaxID=1231624 RepID=A0AAN4R6A0_9PROT|nr:MerR family transcriptional regulator [Asaia bogorensis]BAT19354.1 transcriptional regulator MerR [Asaia bogorensis NBRC 16594]GBQ82116.1 MerR family transcriptional regulator [Asaia bogorensis NBRC 16594]GEL54151.1 MerR family transcriptional regulator [Asaia bogorensis NBRC 16594]
MTTSFPVASVLGGPEERTDFDRLVKGPNAYRTISEVADELHVPQHVLRFWETRFPEVKPLKRGGGRRYYSPSDIEILRHITDLLYVQGYTIKGVQRVLKEQLAGVDTVLAPALVAGSGTEPGAAATSDEAARSSFEIPAFQAPEPEPEPEPAHLAHHPEGDAVMDVGHAMPEESEDLDGPEAAQGPADAHSSDSECDAGAEDLRDSLSEPVESHEPIILDPGEETSGLPVVAASEIASAAPDPVVTQPAASSDMDGALVTILQDELEGLRKEQGRWKQERRALRLALEDVLGELDSLREMLPTA